MQKKPFVEKIPPEPLGKVAELFAGVGGFRLGLASSGWKTVYSNQWEPSSLRQHASEVYVANFGPEGHSNADIAEVEAIPTDFDLLVGGFPCQDYSVAKSAGSATGLKGKKGVLWWEILRLVAKHKPKLVFLENVDRLLKSPSNQRGRDFAVMLASLAGLGYDIEWRVVNAADYGFPQRRVRVFIIARLIGTTGTYSDPNEVIFETGVLARAFPVMPNLVGVANFAIGPKPERLSVEFNVGNNRSVFGRAGFFADGQVFTAQVDSQWQGVGLTLGDVLVSDNEVPDEYWVPKSRLNEWEYAKGAKKIARTQKDSGFEYVYSEGAMAFPDSLAKPSRTILTGEGGNSPSRFKHIVKTKAGYRRLTPVELERLSGFPDNWTNPNPNSPVSPTRRAFLIGNALVVGLVERVGYELAKSELKRG